jgi:hypothetical protein
MTYSAVATEALLPPLILSPFATKLTRRVAIVLAIGLHLSFAALLNLGMFSFNMIGFFCCSWTATGAARRLPRPLCSKARALGRAHARARLSLPATATLRRGGGARHQGCEALVILLRSRWAARCWSKTRPAGALRVTHQPLCSCLPWSTRASTKAEHVRASRCPSATRCCTSTH